MVYFFPYLVMLLGGIGLYLGEAAVWAGFVFLFVVMPVLEFFLKDIKFKSAQYKSTAATVSLYLTPFALSAILFLALRQAYLTEDTLTLVGIALSAGALLGGFGITSAHEMVHRREKKIRAIGVYNLILVNFAYWGLEHVFGHHKYVATPLDPSTARKDEWLYPFWIRNYFGALKGAWHISKERVAAYWALSLVISIALFFTLGLKVLVIWWALSFVAILLLETVDYIEHYALLRPKNQEGNYMAFKGPHSWDSSSVLTNITLFNLGFHAHHHMKAVVRFEDLIEQETANQMPYGYSIMIVMALVPGIYIPYMNKRLPQTI